MDYDRFYFVIYNNIADHVESFTDYDFAHLLFSDGSISQSISLEKRLNIIQAADLVLSDKQTFPAYNH